MATTADCGTEGDEELIRRRIARRRANHLLSANTRICSRPISAGCLDAGGKDGGTSQLCAYYELL